MGHVAVLELRAIGEVLLVGLVLGAGLPVLFAAGIRAMAHGAGGDAETSHARGHPVGTALAVLCFALVVLAVAVGLTYVVASGFGRTLSFDGFVPRIVEE